MPPALVITPQAARQFLRRAHRFDSPWPDVAAALACHGYIQIDPINVCGRMHDLILRNRVAGYREGDLMRFLHGEGAPAAGRQGRPARPDERAADDQPARRASLPAGRRTAFEHHVPGTGILAAFPLEAWPHLLAAMRAWSRRHSAWSGRLTPREQPLARELLAAIAERGPLGAEDFEDDRTARRVWGASRLVKATLQKLFFHGRLLIAQRVHHRRRYDLPARVLPAGVLAQPEPPARDTARWLALLKLRQRRLAALTRDELRLVADDVQPVSVDGCPPLFCLPADIPLLETSGENGPCHVSRDTGDPRAPGAASAVRLLAPLDPMIYDRRVTKALWSFDYTWEAYTPPAKRVRGYYALPVLAGTELVGHVDPKADRAARKLLIASRRLRRGHAAAPALRELAAWLGLKPAGRTPARHPPSA